MRLESPALALTRLAVRRPRQVLWACVLLSIAAAGLAGWRLGFRTSNLDLIDPSLPEVQRFLAFADEFGTPNTLVAVFRGGDKATRRQAVHRAGEKLRLVPGVRTVFDHVPLPPDLLAEAGDEPYLNSRDGELSLVFIQPADNRSSVETIGPLIDGVRRALRDAKLPPGITVGLTGTPVYALDDRDVIQHDISRLSVLSFALILAIFALGFRRLLRPLLAMLCLIAVVALTLGVVSLYPGHLTLLSASFASIIFGLGIDYGIHLVNRFEELLGEGVDDRQALIRAAATSGRGIITGALTTAAVFMTMWFSGFRGFRELGVVAAIGVVISLAITFSLLPALLTLWQPRAHGLAPSPGWVRGLVSLAGRPWVAVLAAVLVVWGIALGHPGFDTNYLDLQPAGSPTVALERELVERSDYSTQFAAFVVKGFEPALDLAEKLSADPTVGSARTIAQLEEQLPPSRSLDELPADFVASFRTADDRYAVYAYPKENVWEPAAQARFVKAMRQYGDPTGMPFLGQFMMHQSLRALKVTALLGGVVLLVLVGIDLKHPLWTLLAVVPTALTFACMQGLMKAAGLSFNPIDVMALPLVIGISVDDGVHMVHRFLQEQGDHDRTMQGTGRSVLLTSLTTLAAFGSLALTTHRGMRSFSLAICLGVGTALVLSLVLLPVAMRLCRRFVVNRPETNSVSK